MITPEQIRGWLIVDKSRLDDEIEHHSQIAEEISRKVSMLEMDVATAKDELKRCEAGLLLDFKKEDTKQTALEVEARVIRNGTRINAFKTFVAYEEQLATWKGLQSAWRDKMFSMRTLADLHGSHYFDSASALYTRRERNEERDLSYRNNLTAAREESNGGQPLRRRTK